MEKREFRLGSGRNRGFQGSGDCGNVKLGLNDESAKKLNLIDDSELDSAPVIITHDCDLLHSKEEFVEIIIGEKIVKPEFIYENAKNPRCLHLRFTTSLSREPVFLELRFSNRKTVSKENFSSLPQKQSILELSENDHRILKRWLAARYGRPAFPSSFENHLRQRRGGKTVVKQIAEILEPVERYISGIFFDLGEHRGVELSSGNPYYLNIIIVYDDESGGTTARKKSEMVAHKIESLFEEVFGTAEDATTISLESCNAVSESHMPLSSLRKVDQWRLEYLSLVYGSSEDFLQTGEILS